MHCSSCEYAVIMEDDRPYSWRMIVFAAMYGIRGSAGLQQRGIVLGRLQNMDHLEHAPNESSLYTSGCTPASASAKTGGRSPDARHTNPQRFSAKLRGLLEAG